jgi:hypothetical protein
MARVLTCIHDLLTSKLESLEVSSTLAPKHMNVRVVWLLLFSQIHIEEMVMFCTIVDVLFINHAQPVIHIKCSDGLLKPCRTGSLTSGA